MAYQPSPRPNFEQPTHLRYENVARHLWGDPEAGEVADWIYVSSNEIHQLVWGLAPGGAFRHSAEFRTIFGADLVYYVLSGVMVIANPQSGEVHRVQPGEAAFFRKDTWHHAFNYSRQPLRVLEFFAPPPAQGASGAYARTKPLLNESKYGMAAALGRWPMQRAEIERDFTITVIGERDRLWRYEGQANQVLVGLLCSTEYLSVGEMVLPPGQKSDALRYGGDMSLYVVEGMLNILCPEKSEAPKFFELQPQDGFYAPAGTPVQFYNLGEQTVRLIFGAAPSYGEK
jgi:mannose-6-phosphate isomerase-like protein (cupin superfamily)